MLTYTKQPDGSFKKEGEVSSRLVTIRRFKNGVWTEPLCPLERANVINLMENTELQYLPADIYEINEVETAPEAVMPEEVKEKLREINESRKADRPLLTCSKAGCDNQYPRNKGRYPQPFCEVHREKK